MSIWPILILGSVIAGFVQGLAGFGFGLVSLGVWSWFIEPELMVPLIVFGSLVGQLLAVGSLRHGFNLHRLLPFLIGGVLGVPTGLALLTLMNPLFFKFGVGVLLTLYCTTALWVAHIPRITGGGRVADGLVGWIGGAMSGFGGLPGAIPTLWCQLRGWPKDQQRTVFQAFNLFMHMLTITAFAANGLITRELTGYFVVMAPAMLIPSLVGIRLYRRFSDSSFRGVVLVMLTISGIMLLISTAPQVWRLL